MPGPANDWSSELQKIAHQTADHNIARPTGVGLILTGLLVLSLAGCGGADQADTSADNKSASSDARDCQVTVNTEGWTSFVVMANQMADGHAVPQEDLLAYAQLPVVSAWRNSQAPNIPRASNVANWLEGAWWDRLGKSGKKKANSNRRTLGRSYRYSQSHGAQIEQLLTEFTDGAQQCVINDLADSWISSENRPRPLVINFLPILAEVRTFEGEIFADTGVLQAGGADQTARQIAALLYRNLEGLQGQSPLESEGEQSVAECLRVVMNEGIAGWIEKTTDIEFDSAHPSLHKVHIVPEDFFTKTQETVRVFENMLPPLFADPTKMADNGNNFARYLAGSNAFSQTGIGMATVIAVRLGEERLQQEHLSVPGFLAAYQEAALQNATPLPIPGTLGVELYETVPALSPTVYEPLHALVTKYFATR